MADTDDSEVPQAVPREKRYERYSAYLKPERWEAARRAKALITARTGRDVAITDLLRWGLHLVLQRVADGNLEPPEGYEG